MKELKNMNAEVYKEDTDFDDAKLNNVEEADNDYEEYEKDRLIYRQLCQGVHMMAVKREDLIAPILDMSGVASVNQVVSV